jgi:predicted nucleic acid-binding protein
MSLASTANVAVVDASLVTMWALLEPLSARAHALANEWSRAGTRLIAPAFMLAEVTNAVYKRAWRGELPLDEVEEALELILALGIGLEESADVHREALALAHGLRRPSTYDAHYLVLADLHGCEVWTGDERLYNAVGGQFPALRWIGNYTPPRVGP